MDLDLSGKVVMVTGASRGLGYAIARKFAQEGANLIINSRISSNITSAAGKIKKQYGVKVVPIPGDITSVNTCNILTSAMESEFNRLDILVVNSGGPKSGAFEELTDKDWQSAFDLCFLGQARIIKLPI